MGAGAGGSVCSSLPLAVFCVVLGVSWATDSGGAVRDTLLFVAVCYAAVCCQTYFSESCYNMTGLEVNGYDPCRAHTVNLPFEVDIAAFEVAILNAMDHVG